MGQAIADKYGIEFYYEDFRELYRREEISRVSTTICKNIVVVLLLQ